MDKVKWAGAVLLACAMPVLVSAQTSAALRGKVLNDADDKPLAGATVAIASLNLSTTSDSLGNFLLRGVTPGRQIVQVRRLGFGFVSSVVAFAGGDTVEQDFGLVATVAKLPQVDVKAAPNLSPKLSEFEGRRKEGFGHFVTEAELTKDGNRRVSEILAKVPGITVKQGTTNAAWVATARGPKSFTAGFCPGEMDKRRGAKCGCYAKVVLDGVEVFSGISAPAGPGNVSGGQDLWDINSLHPSDILGIEIYNGPATTPAKYNSTSNTCGVVVIWTK